MHTHAGSCHQPHYCTKVLQENFQSTRTSSTKFYVEKGGRAVKATGEMRDWFTYVPWCDANGTLIFAQLIFVGKTTLTEHVLEALVEAPVLLQFAESGKQTGETFREALDHLEMYVRLRHSSCSDETIALICDAKKCVSTDGASRVYDIGVLQTANDYDIAINIREGNSSFITQMWDQIFYAFTHEYEKMVMAHVRLVESLRQSTENHAKLSKRIVTAIVIMMHKGGQCSWAPAGIVLAAFAKVGIAVEGLNVDLLLQNKLIRGYDIEGAAQKAADGAGDNGGPAGESDEEEDGMERPGTWFTPRKFQRQERGSGKWTTRRSMDYLEAKLKHTERLLASYMVRPEELAEVRSTPHSAQPLNTAARLPLVYF